MRGKLIGSIMAGVYISIGAMVYLAVPNPIIGALLFPIGIFLILNFNSLLFTLVIPMSVATKEYGAQDMCISITGNFIGTVIVALFTRFSRFGNKITESIKIVAESRLNDNFLSLVIMGVFCGILVAYAVIASRKYKLGSFPQIFFVWLFISGFVICGFDHIIADFYYLFSYGFIHGFDVLTTIKVLVAVLIGNIIGGLFVGFTGKNYIPTKSSK